MATLIDLKIDAFLSGARMGLPETRDKDRVDVQTLIRNNQFSRDLLKGKFHQGEYEKLWDILHKPPKKVSHEEAVKMLLDGLNMVGAE